MSSSGSDNEDCPPVTFKVMAPKGYPLERPGVGLEIRESCPVCGVGRPKFYCGQCTSQGQFYHSRNLQGGNFSQLSCQLSGLTHAIDQRKAKIRQLEEMEMEQRQKQEDMMLCRQRIKYLKHLVKDKTKSRDQLKEASMKLTSVNERRTLRLPLFKDKVTKIARCVDQYVADLDHEGLKSSHARQKLEACLNKESVGLFEKLFPVGLRNEEQDREETQAEGSSDPNLESAIEMEKAMADAMSTSYIQGRWVTTSFQLSRDAEEKDARTFEIASAHLPAHSDFSAYPAFSSALDTESTSILAALTFSSQLTSQLHLLWDEISPSKPSGYGDFGLSCSHYKFAKMVACLNLNIIYLCLKLGLDPGQLKATHTLQNLYVLLQHLKANSGTSKGRFPSDDFKKLAIEVTRAELDGLSPGSEDMDDNDGHRVDSLIDEEWESLSENINEAITIDIPSSPSTAFITSLVRRGF